MRFNSKGDLAGGHTVVWVRPKGGVPTPIATGFFGGWLDDDTILAVCPDRSGKWFATTFSRADNWAVGVLYTPFAAFDGEGPNFIKAGGGRAIAARPNPYLFLDNKSEPRTDGWMPQDVSPTGDVMLVKDGVYKYAGHDYFGFLFARAMADGKMMWKTSDGHIEPAVTVPGNAYWPFAFGEWVGYWIEEYGLLIHPRSNPALVHQRKVRSAFSPELFLDGTTATLAYSPGEAELPTEIIVETFTIGAGLTVPVRIDIPPPPPPPPQEPPTMLPTPQQVQLAVEIAKATTEREGYIFPPVQSWDEPAKVRAMRVIIRAAWALKQQFPDAGIGLEHYGGDSGADFLGDRYSPDIIAVGGPTGVTYDVLVAGTTPSAQEGGPVGDNWRAPIDPARLPGQTTPPPPPPPPPPVDPPPSAPALQAILDAILTHDRVCQERLGRLEASLDRIERTINDQGEVIVTFLSDLNAIEKAVKAARPFTFRAGILGTVNGTIKELA